MRARDFAIKAHGEQRYGDLPYVFHLDTVAGILEGFGLGSSKMIDAAYLHDVLEDCSSVSYEDLVLAFPESAPIVEKVTGRGASRQIRNRDIKTKISGDKDAQNLKAADRLANMRVAIFQNKKMYEMYKKEISFFLESIPLAHPTLIAALSDIANIDNIV